MVIHSMQQSESMQSTTSVDWSTQCVMQLHNTNASMPGTQLKIRESPGLQRININDLIQGCASKLHKDDYLCQCM